MTAPEPFRPIGFKDGDGHGHGDHHGGELGPGDGHGHGESYGNEDGDGYGCGFGYGGGLPYVYGEGTIRLRRRGRRP